jgi:hypothetical protein
MKTSNIFVLPNNKVRRVAGNYSGFFHSENNYNLPTARLTLNLRSAVWEVISFNRLLYKLNISKTTFQTLRVIKGEFKNPFAKSVGSVHPDNQRPPCRNVKSKRQRCNCVILRLDNLRSIINISYCISIIHGGM